MHNSDINVSEIIKKIEEDDFEHIDSYVLSNLVKIVHQLGLKKGEVLKLKIKDVVDESGGVVEQINIGKRKITVSPEVAAIIEGQIDYLKANGSYNTDEESPLFQNRRGGEYSEAARQLRKNFNSPKFEKIRQTGLKKYDDFLKHLSDEKRMNEMEKFTGLSPKQISGIINDRMQKAGRKKAPYEKDSYMDGIIDRLQNQNDIEFSEFLAILDKLNEFDMDDMSKVERLKNAYFNAVDINKTLNKNAEGIDEEKKANSKRIFKKWFLEKLCNKRIVFDPVTNKPRKDPQSEKNRGPMPLFEAITGKAPDIRIYKTPTNKNPTDLKTFEIQDKSEKLKERMDQNFKIDINTLLNNCNFNPVKSYVSQLLKILIDQFPIEISDEKLSDKDKGIIQESFDILIGGKVKNISFHSTDKPFFKYKNMVHYVAKEEYVSRYGKKWDDYEIYQIERDILLKIIRISWNIFTENERKIFYLGLCDNKHLHKFKSHLVSETDWVNQFFEYTLFEELFGSNSTAFLKIAALIVNSTYFYYFNNDIPIKLDKTHKRWRDLFRDKIIKTIRKRPYGEARMAMSGCISCISLLRQIEFLKDKGITLEDTPAFQVDPAEIFFLTS